MYKKLSLALVTALLIAMCSISWASAAADTTTTQKPDRRALIGQITEINGDEFTIETKDNKTHTIVVGEETNFRSRDGLLSHTASYADLEIGLWVAVVNNTEFTAQLVVILPEDFNPETLPGKQIIGKVDKINTGKNTFTITNRAEKTLTFTVDDKTRYYGTISSLEDIEKDMSVGVVAIKQEDGTLLAKLVANQRYGGEPYAKTSGKITSISNSSLTITKKDGTTLNFTLTENTKFFSRDENLSEIGNLQTDMSIVIVYQKTEAKVPDAGTVIALDQSLLNLGKAFGEVHSVGTSTFNLQTADGKILTFTINESTRLFGKGLTRLEDLNSGMKIFVAYKIDENDNLIAVNIAARVNGE